MIVAAGLSPAWQRILVFDRLTPGEVNRARETVECASGKVLNVGRACHALGGEVVTLSPAGGPAGERMVEEFARDGLAARWIRTQTPTRTCTTLIDSDLGEVTELVENAAALRSEEVDEFIAAYREAAAGADLVVLTGSLPPQVGTDFYARLMGLTPARVLLDVRGPELLAALPQRPWLVKPNCAELEHTVGRPLSSETDLHAAMRDLNLRGAEWVLVTQGTGPLWLSSRDELHRFEPVRVSHPLNPIGCGDCLAAGIAVAVSAGEALPDAVSLGIAAAAENAGALLPARLERAAVERRRRDVGNPQAAVVRPSAST